MIMLIVYLNPCILSSAPLSLILRSGNTTSSPVPIWSALLLPAASLIITAEVALPIPSVRFQYEQDEPLSETKPSRLGLGHGGVIGGGRRRGVRHDDGAPILARSTCSTPPLPLDFGRRCEPLVCAPDTSLPIRFEGSSLHHGRVKGMRFAAKGNVKSEAKERIESILGPLPDPIADLTTASRTYDSGDFVTALTDAIAFLFAVERKQKDQAAFENRLSGVPCLSRSAGGGAFSVVSGRGQAFSKWFVWDMPKPPVSTGGHVTVLCPDEATARRQAMEFASSSAFYNKGNSLFNLPARYLAKRAEAGNARQFPIDDAIPGLAMRWFRKGGPAEVDAIHDAVATGKLTRRFKFDGDDVTVPVPEGQSADTSAFKANLNKLKAVVQEAEYLLMTPHEFVEKETGRRALKYSMYRVRQLDVDFQPVVINPYWLGLWLGDGNRRNTVIFNFHESEIRAFLIQYAELLDKPDKTALDAVQLARGLGFKVQSHRLTNRIPYLDGTYGDALRARITGDSIHEIPCLLGRKKALKRIFQQQQSWIFQIAEEEHPKPAEQTLWSIAVDGDNKFVHDDMLGTGYKPARPDQSRPALARRRLAESMQQLSTIIAVMEVLDESARRQQSHPERLLHLHAHITVLFDEAKRVGKSPLASNEEINDVAKRMAGIHLNEVAARPVSTPRIRLAEGGPTDDILPGNNSSPCSLSLAPSSPPSTLPFTPSDSDGDGDGDWCVIEVAESTDTSPADSPKVATSGNVTFDGNTSGNGLGNIVQAEPMSDHDGFDLWGEPIYRTGIGKEDNTAQKSGAPSATSGCTCVAQTKGTKDGSDSTVSANDTAAGWGATDQGGDSVAETRKSFDAALDAWTKSLRSKDGKHGAHHGRTVDALAAFFAAVKARDAQEEGRNQ
ncbi:uncharacterized protein EHS24_001603 [Apiotrichum porosum]|uniref:Uncharacterized protein n=1 Tax=Apiotrichum porosum TaxID=105984 RepID=A0A427XIN3_9TREE|nr:uncharacterized protein EHS24_001603 [Apiotrichum porosum]RSH78706.1 hypothetical protein EHS24_001603 [Apiotrichum porosum]